MFKKIFLALLMGIQLNALNIEVNTQNLDEVSAEISSDSNIARVKKEQKKPYQEVIATASSVVVDEKDTTRKELQRDFSKIKRLQEYLPNTATQTQLKSLLQSSFFSLHANQKQILSFAYALEYPISENYDAIYAKMQQKISLYILQTYGVTNVEYKLIMKDLELASQEIDTSSIGTVEIIPSKKNKFHNIGNRRVSSGIIKFNFYPFKKVKRADSSLSTIDYSSTTSDEKIDFVDFEKNKDVKKITSYFIDGDENLFESFLDSYNGTNSLNIAKTLSFISSKRSKYEKVAKSLFAKYPSCENIGMLDKKLKKNIADISVQGGEREFIYEYTLSNELEFSDAVYMAYRKLKRNLKQDTTISSLDSKESLGGNGYKHSANESKIVPVYKNISIEPFYKANSLGLYIKVSVSFEQSNLCAQYYVGKVYEPKLKISFIQLKNEEGDVVEYSQTEITNATFNRFMSKKRDFDCQKTKGNSKPANCLTYEMIEEFISILNNKYGEKYEYRLPKCDEWLFLATCNKKQKYCWGNTPNYKEFEHLRVSKNGFRLKKVASKKANGLELFDFCGNGYEYCKTQRDRYRAGASNMKSYVPEINRRSWSEIEAIRLVRVKND